jgi:hypothetical protein
MAIRPNRSANFTDMGVNELEGVRRVGAPRRISAAIVPICNGVNLPTIVCASEVHMCAERKILIENDLRHVRTLLAGPNDLCGTLFAMEKLSEEKVKNRQCSDTASY